VRRNLANNAGRYNGDGDPGDGPFVIDLPLADEAATVAVVASHDGYIQGGSFGPEGWTTTSRDDIIVIPLPPGTGAARGDLEFSAANFEWDLTNSFWEAWVLVSLDSEGPPFSPTDAGVQSGIQALYQGFNPDDPNNGYRPVGYFNLFDPDCPDWPECTGEARTPAFWLSNDGTAYTLSHSWDDNIDNLGFLGGGAVNKTVDLSATSPNGKIVADQMYLMINACGGSTVNTSSPLEREARAKPGSHGAHGGRRPSTGELQRA
jgi:hypothetical protein